MTPTEVSALSSAGRQAAVGALAISMMAAKPAQSHQYVLRLSDRCEGGGLAFVHRQEGRQPQDQPSLYVSCSCQPTGPIIMVKHLQAISEVHTPPQLTPAASRMQV